MATVVLLLACTVIHFVKASLVNVALNKPASMSSRFFDGYNASTAVDGKFADGWGGEIIIDTGIEYDFAWWKVDLQREVQDATVRIFFRTPYAWRRNGVELYTSTRSFPDSNPTSQGQLCHTITGDPSGSDIPDVYTVTCLGRWRYLLLYTDTDNLNNGASTGPTLDFGEVEVLVCSDGIYGEHCTKTCRSRNCVTMTTTCDRDGRCPDGCQSGWKGVDCTQECDYGSFGPGCSLSCTDRKCREPSTDCNQVTGQCRNGCKSGYIGITCIEQCDSGSYGDGCSFPCTERNCYVSSSACNHVTGQCEGGCQTGYQGTDCRQACNQGYKYGVNCIKSCSDRHCIQPSSVCDTKTGQCSGGCQEGWRGDDCTSQPNDENIAAVVTGTVLGTLLLVFLLVFVCLIRQGRLQWVKSSEDKKPGQMSRDSTQMSNISRQAADDSEHAHQSSNMHRNDYDVLDQENMPGNKNYDVIQHKEYENA